MEHEEYHEYEAFCHQFQAITKNLWYTWNPDAQKVLNILLNKDNHTLSSFERFNSLTEEKKQELFRDIHIRATVSHVYDELQEYLSRPTWFDAQLENRPELDVFNKHPVAYLCAEYGLTEWLNIYSGGLGILAGDILKEASDLGIPMVGIGLLYQYGFFRQKLSNDGYQTEEYFQIKPDELPLTPIRISTGAPLLVEITMVDHPIYCKIWTAHVGRIPLYLLDTNIEENSRIEDKLITGHLYGGNDDTRIRQEIVLGIGGERALSALGYHPSVFSMNEGHSAFAALEITKHFMQERGLSFGKARERTKTKITYTNHTLVAAGNDAFSLDLISKYLTPYLTALGITPDQLFELGKNKDNPQTFSMPELAFKMSMVANGVSKPHAEHARAVWPDYNIIAITNGVHMPSWVAPRLQRVYAKYISEDWQTSVEDDHIWQNALNIPSEELWQVHSTIKKEAFARMNDIFGIKLDPEALTITWSRRFTPYKRPHLLVSNPDWLAEILKNHPIQILYAGKSHPKDNLGKEMMQNLYRLSQDARFKGKIFLLPDYNITLAKDLVSASDVWLNNPEPGKEASGTSGMKAAANGTLQFSSYEGWVAEVDWQDFGFVIDSQGNEADTIYHMLEQKIIPTYFLRDAQNTPQAWVTAMKKTISTVCPMFSTKRTLIEYLEKMYEPATKKQ